MNKRSMRISAFLAFFAALITLLTLTSATYAWFTFTAATNVTPISGTVSHGEGSLLISNDRGGPFDVSCELRLDPDSGDLSPLSTADLEHFFASTVQDSSGITLRCADVSDLAASRAVHGKVYLLSEGNDFTVYLWKDGLSCGSDDQALAAMRLGLKITTAEGTMKRIFRLDELGSTSGAAAQLTVPQDNSVVAAISENGTPVYVRDVSVPIGTSFAHGGADRIEPGETALCSLREGEIAEVEYWLYLEGCDINCINTVQRRDVALRLQFAGIQR